MDYDSLLKVFDKEKLAEIIVKKDKEIDWLKMKIENQVNLGKIFFEGKNYYVIFEEIK
jgi:ADP-dependent phosphofructokinase/glucokinase